MIEGSATVQRPRPPAFSVALDDAPWGNVLVHQPDAGEALELRRILGIAGYRVQAIVKAWRIDYNTVRPHSRLGNLPPAVYGATRSSAPEMHRGGALRSTRGFAPRPDAPQSERSKQEQTQQ